MSDPIKINASAFIPVLTQIVTKLLAIAGAFLVTHGFLSDDQLTAAIPAAAQEIVGMILALGAVAWGAWRSKRSNDDKVAILESPDTFVPKSVAVLKEGSTTPPLASFVPFLFILLSAGGISGCSTVGDVRLNANKTFYAAQIALRSVQQTTLVTCTRPLPALVEPCQKAIVLLDQGAKAEAVGFTAQQAGNASGVQEASIILIALPSQLAALGVLEAK